jgi:hypothetical protein
MLLGAVTSIPAVMQEVSWELAVVPVGAVCFASERLAAGHAQVQAGCRLCVKLPRALMARLEQRFVVASPSVAQGVLS